MRISTVVALLLGVSVLVAPAALAQDDKTLKKAARAIDPEAPVEDVRQAFQMLSDSLRGAPNLATPRGWWLRGEAAVLLTLKEGPTGNGTVEVAIESFREAAKAGVSEPDLTILASLEEELTRRASSSENPRDAYRAALLLVSADAVRQDLDVSQPVDRVRRMALATDAALKANEVRSARMLLGDLDRMGGFIEPLALAVVKEVETQEGPGIAFTFIGDLRERHPKNKALLAAATELCLKQGWMEEGRAALDAAEPQYKDTYDDHLIVGGYRETLGDLDQAATHFRKARAHAPKGFEANWHLASLLLRQAEALDPEDPEQLEATRLLREEALKSLATVLESNPEHADALRNFVEQSTVLEIEIDPEVQTRHDTLFPPATASPGEVTDDDVR